MKLLIRLMPWFTQDEQDARAARTEAVSTKVQESLKRVTDAQTRAAIMVQSYRKAGDRLCR